MTASQKELLIRAAILTAIGTIPKIGKVHAERDYTGSEHQFIANHGEKSSSSKQIEIKSSVIELTGFEDTDGGFDENPNYFLVYRIHVFHGFVEKRPDGTNSTNDFIAVCLSLRDKFLTRDILNIADSECEPLTVSRNAEISDDTGFTEAYGHSIDFELRILICPDC